jgi:hypothetical protein
MPALVTRTDVGAAQSSHQDQIIDDMADPTPVIASYTGARFIKTRAI